MVAEERGAAAAQDAAEAGAGAEGVEGGVEAAVSVGVARALGIAAGLAINQPSRRAAISPIVAPGLAGVVIDITLAGSVAR